jgi:acyl CoA:acetate/3-ketoacid CoA transferase beta subunit
MIERDVRERADRLVCAMAREVAQAPLAAVGLATTMPFVAVVLARRVHAPRLRFVSVVGCALVEEPFVLRLRELEREVLARARAVWDFADSVRELLPREHPLEFFRPAQIDACGNTNNVRAAGGRLPVAAGIPDVTRYHTRIYYYVPRHRREVFVERVEVVSGLGFPRPPGTGPGPRAVLTDLGKFDFAEGRMRLAAVHAGVRVKEIRAATGFGFDVASPLAEMPPPSAEERAALEEVDPEGLRYLEVLPARERWARLAALTKGPFAGW